MFTSSLPSLLNGHGQAISGHGHPFKGENFRSLGGELLSRWFSQGMASLTWGRSLANALLARSMPARHTGPFGGLQIHGHGLLSQTVYIQFRFTDLKTHV